MRVPTLLFGDVEVRYERRDDGTEWLMSVKPGAATSLEWSRSPTGPPPFLLELDLSDPTKMRSYMRGALEEAMAARQVVARGPGVSRRV